MRELDDTEAVQAVSSRGVLAHPDLASLNAMEKNRKYPKLEEYRAVRPARKASLQENVSKFQTRTDLSIMRGINEGMVRKSKSLCNIRAVKKMKHGHQSPWYRKSVRAGVKPEEEDV